MLSLTCVSHPGYKGIEPGGQLFYIFCCYSKYVLVSAGTFRTRGCFRVRLIRKNYNEFIISAMMMIIITIHFVLSNVAVGDILISNSSHSESPQFDFQPLYKLFSIRFSLFSLVFLGRIKSMF
jgi:hypothetical protein